MRTVYMYGVSWDYYDDDVNVTMCVSEQAAMRLAVDSSVELANELQNEPRADHDEYDRMCNTHRRLEDRFEGAVNWRAANGIRMQLVQIMVPEEAMLTAYLQATDPEGVSQ